MKRGIAVLLMFSLAASALPNIEASAADIEEVQEYDAGEVYETVFGTKTLIVQSEEENFDTLSADLSIPIGNGFYAAAYESEEQAQDAYQQYLQMDGILSVEPDLIVAAQDIELSEFEKADSEVAQMGESIEVLDGIQPDIVTVALIDTGISDWKGHPSASYIRTPANEADSYFYDFTDENGHGTQLAALMTDFFLQEGLDAEQIQILPVKVADKSGQCTILQLYLGIRYAVLQGADILNISLGTKNLSQSALLKWAVADAVEKGSILVTSAGNENAKVSGYSPANIEEVITVGAVNDKKNRLEYSNYGSTLDCVSYGSGLYLPSLDGRIVEANGTSYAAALVSAELAKQAVICGAKKEYTLSQANAYIASNALDLGEEGRDDSYGYGFIGTYDYESAPKLREEQTEAGSENEKKNEKENEKENEAGNENKTEIKSDTDLSAEIIEENESKTSDNTEKLILDTVGQEQETIDFEKETEKETEKELEKEISIKAATIYTTWTSLAKAIKKQAAGTAVSYSIGADLTVTSCIDVTGKTVAIQPASVSCTLKKDAELKNYIFKVGTDGILKIRGTGLSTTNANYTHTLTLDGNGNQSIYGCLQNKGGKIALMSGSIVKNGVAVYGGGVDNQSGTLQVCGGSLITGCKAYNVTGEKKYNDTCGGGIKNTGIAYIYGGTISYNSCTETGGGIWNKGELYLSASKAPKEAGFYGEGCDISYNTAKSASAVMNNKTLKAGIGKIHHNTAESRGTIGNSQAGTATCDYLEVYSNDAGAAAAYVNSGGTLTITNSNIHDNKNTVSNVYTTLINTNDTGYSATTILSGCSINGNTGGGVGCYYNSGKTGSSITNIDNCNIYKNTTNGIVNNGIMNIGQTAAVKTYDNGANGITSNGTITIKNSHIYNNAAGIINDVKSDGTKGSMSVADSYIYCNTSYGLLNKGTISSLKDTYLGVSSYVKSGTDKYGERFIDFVGNKYVHNKGDAIFNYSDGTISEISNCTIAAGLGETTAYGINNAGTIESMNQSRIYMVGGLGAVNNTGTFTIPYSTESCSIRGSSACGITNSGTLKADGLTLDGSYTRAAHPAISGTVYMKQDTNRTRSFTTGIQNTGTLTFDKNAILNYCKTGILNEKGTLNINGTIRYCKENGVVVNGGEVTISDGTNSENQIGVCVNGGTVSFTAGYIQKNNEYGILINHGIFHQTGGTITGNKAYGVYLEANTDSHYYMGGAARVSTTNNVCLGAEKYIEIKSRLTTSGTAAKLTPLNEKKEVIPQIKENAKLADMKAGGLGRVLVKTIYSSGKGSEALYDTTQSQRFLLSNNGLLRPGNYMDDEAVTAEQKAEKISNRIADTDIVISTLYAVTYEKNINETDVNNNPIEVEAANIPQEQQKYWCETLKLSDSSALEPAAVTDPYASYYMFANWNDRRDGTGSVYSSGSVYRENQPLVLFAVWDKKVNISYIGNEQSAGEDFTEYDIALSSIYTFSDNVDEDGEKHFKKTVVKSFTDIETGEVIEEETTAEVVGWSFFKKRIGDYNIYEYDIGSEIASKELYQVAGWETKIFTIGAPAADYGTYPKFQKNQLSLQFYNQSCDTQEYGHAEGTASNLQAAAAGSTDAACNIFYHTPHSQLYLNFYAIWDAGAVVEAYDLYYTLTEAKRTTDTDGITETKLLSQAAAIDDEDGILPQGKNIVHKNGKQTSFYITNYSAAAFSSMTTAGSVTINYRAVDSTGNITERSVTVHIVDTSAEKINEGKVRFISSKYADTLAEHSVWSADEAYRAELAAVLNNHKVNIEMYEGTILGIPVSYEKPASGFWESEPEETWVFTHEQVEAVKAYVDKKGKGKIKDESALQEFMAQFSSCRK